MMMYSTGMPILYAFGCIFYFALYWVYKILLLKHYMKTTTFNNELCTKAGSMIKYAVIFHLIFGAIMMTNSKIIHTDNDNPY